MNGGKPTNDVLRSRIHPTTAGGGEASFPGAGGSPRHSQPAVTDVVRPIREVFVTTAEQSSAYDWNEDEPRNPDTGAAGAEDTATAPHADVVVKGRNVEVPDHFRIYVSEKLARVERFDSSRNLFDVELFHEPNRRQRKNCQRVEITAKGKGPVVRAEACADSFYAALEAATSKLETRMRRLRDRRKVHYGEKTPVSVAEATASLGAIEAEALEAKLAKTPEPEEKEPETRARPDRADQGALGRADERRRRALPDGTGRTRFLPVPRRGDRPTVGRLPPARVRLRRDTARLISSSPCARLTGRGARQPRTAR